MAQDLTGLLGGALLPAAQPITPTSAADYTRIMQEANKGFRQSVGGMFGVDTRTTPEFVQEEAAKLDPTKVEDQAKLVELIGKVDPSRALALKSVFAQQAANTQSQAAAAAQEEKRYQEKLALDIRKTEAAEKKASPRYVNLGGGSFLDTETQKITSVPKDEPKSKILTPDAQKAILTQADNRGIGADARKALVKGLETGIVTGLDDIKDYLPETVSPEYSVFLEKTIEASNEDFVKGSRQASEAERLLNDISRAGVTSAPAGLASRFSEGYKELTGTRDVISELRTRSTKAINTEIIDSLPPGIASDTDVRIFSAGFPNPETASFEEIINYLEASKRISLIRADAGQFKNQFIARNMDKYGQSRLERLIPEQRAFFQASELFKERVTDTSLTPEQIQQEKQSFYDAFGMIPAGYN